MEVEYELWRPVARHGEYALRAIRSDEWERVRELRLAALRDPVAAVAFVESYEEAEARPDAFWQERAEGGSVDRGTWIRQFVAEAADGRWAGTVTVLVERPEDGRTLFGDVVTVPQTDVVGVYVRPEARGDGLVDALLRVAVEWSWARPAPLVERVRLFVHEENARAAAVYRRFGFVPTGGRADTLGSGEPRELEHELRRPV
ncbi:GNAT family N-acetyltransferase [Streptomyces sp. P9-A4]